MLEENTEIKEETILFKIKEQEQQKEIETLLTDEQQEMNIIPPVSSGTLVEDSQKEFKQPLILLSSTETATLKTYQTPEEEGKKEKEICKEKNVLEAVITPPPVVNHHEEQQVVEVEDVNTDDDDYDDIVGDKDKDCQKSKFDEDDFKLQLLQLVPSLRKSAKDSDNDFKDPLEYLSFAGITITKGGFNRVNNPTGAFLSDDLVALRIELFLSNLDPHLRERVHSFDPGFYFDRLRDLNQDLSHWVKHIDIFAMDFIFIPISMDSHFSLCVVVRPMEWMKKLYLFNDPLDDNDLQQEACILFLDSIGGKLSHRGYHNCQIIGLNIRRFLSCLWLYEVEKNSNLSAKPSTATGYSRYTHMQISEYINRIVCTERYLTVFNNGRGFFRDVPILYCPTTPKQNNGFDCGYYTFKFLELIVKLFPTSLSEDLSQSFSNWIQEDLITPDDIAKEKQLFKSILENLHDAFEANKKNPEMLASIDNSFCVYQNNNSVLKASSDTTTNETTDFVPEDFNHTIVIEGCVETNIGDLQIFVDATIYYPNNKELHCNAGTVMCGTHKPLLLIMFAFSPYGFCNSATKVQELLVEDVQVISLNLDEYRSDVEKLLSLTSLEDRVNSIFDAENDFKLVSEAWTDVHENHLNIADQQQWWCGYKEGLSDIANGLLSYYCKCKEDAIRSIVPTKSISPMKVLSCTTWTKNDDNQKLCKLEITFGIVQSKVTNSIIIRKTVVEPPKTSIKDTDVQNLDAFKLLSSKTPEPINVIPTISPQPTVITSTLDSKGVTNSNSSNSSIQPRSSKRVKKLPEFLLSTSSSDPTNNQYKVKKARIGDNSDAAKKLFSKKVQKQQTLGGSSGNKKQKKVVNVDSESFSESFHDYHNYGAHSSFEDTYTPFLDTAVTDAPKRRSTRTSNAIAADTRFIVDVAADKSAKDSEMAVIASKAEKARLLSAIADAETRLRLKEDEQNAENIIAATKIAASLAVTEALRRENDAKELLIRDALAETKRMQEQLLMVQKQKEDLDRKIFEAELTAKWKVDNATLQESNKLLLCQIKLMETGKVDLETSNEKTKEDALKIFKSGLDYQEKSNSKISVVVQEHSKQTTEIVKSILENAASTQSQLLLSSSQLLPFNNHSAPPLQGKEPARIDKKKKEKKKQQKSKKIEILKEALKLDATLDATYEVEKKRLKDLKEKRREHKQTVPSLYSSSSAASSDTDCNDK